MKYFSLLLLFISFFALASVSAEEVNSFIFTDANSFHQVLQDINSTGGQATFKFGKEIIWAYIPSDRTHSFGENAKLFTGQIENATIESLNLTDIQKSIFNAWNLRFVKSSEKSLGITSTKKPSLSDATMGREGVFEKPARSNNNFALSSALASALPNDDKYLIGDVAIGLIFVQNRATDGQTDYWWVTNYDWDSEEYSMVINKLVTGLSWLGQQNSNAHITWSFDYTEDALVNTEPTDGESLCSGGWVDQALSYMGYSNYDSYTSALRNNYNSDWAVGIFMTIGNIEFSDGYFAYECGLNSNSGKIFSTYEAGNYGHQDLNNVLTHEMAHAFGADDKYCQPGYSCCTCSSSTGYLNIANSNCEAGCFPGYEDSCGSCVQVSSLMRNNDWVIDSVTAQQIGWKDSDGDNILDPVDTYPFDYDNDGIRDSIDNCRQTVNPNQSDIDRDGIGDVCDDDMDGDGVLNPNDDCPTIFGLIEYLGCPDTFPPSITIFSPTNGTYYNLSLLFSEVHFGEITKWANLYLDGELYLVSENESEISTGFLSLSQGIHTYVVSASDFLNNVGNKSIQFFIDTIKPVINSVRINGQPDILGDQVIIGDSLSLTLNYSENNVEEINGLCAYNVSDISTYKSKIDYNVSSGINKIWNWTLNLSSRLDNSKIDDCQICIKDKAGNLVCWSKLGDFIIDKCLPSIFQINNSCNTSDNFISWFNDTNKCFTKTGTITDQVPNNQTFSCNYCSENITPQLYTNWSICANNDTQARTKYFVDKNYNSCCVLTGLSSDCHILNASYNNIMEIQQCDYCSPNWVEVNSSCKTGDFKTGWFNDTNNCFSKTGLASDLVDRPLNKTYNFSCDFSGDGIIGDIGMTSTNFENLTIWVNNSDNRSENLGPQDVIISNDGKKILEFNFKFIFFGGLNCTNSTSESNVTTSCGGYSSGGPDSETLNLHNLIIFKQDNDSNYASLTISGLDLTFQNRTKTVYLNRILNGTGLCIKDEEISSINEISGDCKSSNEFWIPCPFNGSYSCEFFNNSQYKISGLKHSGVKELATYCGDAICNGAETCSSCSIDCGSCPSNPASGGGGGGGGGGGASTVKKNATISANSSNSSLNPNSIDPLDINSDYSNLSDYGRFDNFGITGKAIFNEIASSKKTYILSSIFLIILLVWFFKKK